MTDISYQDGRELSAAQLEALFLSVEWSSGHYPDRLAAAMRGSATVFTAWDGDTLVGLVNALDDGGMTAYIHYLLVNPAYQGRGIGRELLRRICDTYRDYLRIVLISYKKEIGFYEAQGFKLGDDHAPMFITSLWT